MVFDPKIYHNSKDGIGDPGDPRAASADEASTLVSLSKALLYAFNVTGISVTFAPGNLGPGTATAALRTVAANNSPDTLSLASIDTKLTTLNFNTDTLEIALGTTTETAPATDTALSGLNGRLQRVAQRLAAGAANIAKAEDAASADGDVGVPAMAVVKATPADTVGADGDYQPLQMKSGRLWVDPSGVSLTVGTHAVTQSGTWNVTNISGTISLPTGAATAAKQPALGTAGTPSADVLTVQGSATGTAIPVSIASVPSHAVTNAGTFAVQATQAGTWNVTVNAALPAGSNIIGALTANQSVNAAQINGVTPLMGNGVTGTGSQRVTIASDNTAFSVNAVQSGTWNVATVSTVTNLSQLGGVAIAMGTGARSTGTQRVTIATDDVVPVTLGAGSAIAGKVGIDQTSGQNLVKQVRSTTGTQSSVAGSASSVTVLASNANRLGASVYNDSTSILYLLLSSGTASATAYSVQVAASGYFEVPAFYTGAIIGIWASATGNARVTELT